MDKVSENEFPVFETYRASTDVIKSEIRPRGYKTFFVLDSVKREISNAHKYKNIKKFGFFKAQLSLDCYFSAHTC